MAEATFFNSNFSLRREDSIQIDLLHREERIITIVLHATYVAFTAFLALQIW